MVFEEYQLGSYQLVNLKSDGVCNTRAWSTFLSLTLVFSRNSSVTSGSVSSSNFLRNGPNDSKSRIWLLCRLMLLRLPLFGVPASRFDSDPSELTFMTGVFVFVEILSV